MQKLWPPGRGQFWPQGHNLNNFGRGRLNDAIYQIWKLWALQFRTRRCLKIAFSKTYLLTPWPTYATNWNGLNNFERGPPRDHSCEVWSKSNKWFQRRCCLKKLLTDARTHGRRTLKDHKSSLSTSCSGELKTRLKDVRFTLIYWKMLNCCC